MKSTLTTAFPSKKWVPLFHARKEWHKLFTTGSRTVSLPCRLVYGYLVLRSQNKPQPTSRTRVAKVLKINSRRLNAYLALLVKNGLVSQVGRDFYAAQPPGEMMPFFVPKQNTEAKTWHGQLASIPVLLRTKKKGLSNLDVAVLSVVYNFADRQHLKYRTAASISHFLGSTKRTIRQSFGRLRKLGFLALDDGGKQVLTVANHPSDEQLAFFRNRRKGPARTIEEGLHAATTADQYINHDFAPPPAAYDIPRATEIRMKLDRVLKAGGKSAPALLSECGVESIEAFLAQHDDSRVKDTLILDWCKPARTTVTVTENKDDALTLSPVRDDIDDSTLMITEVREYLKR